MADRNFRSDQAFLMSRAIGRAALAIAALLTVRLTGRRPTIS
jgi:hypothetical protein